MTSRLLALAAALSFFASAQASVLDTQTQPSAHAVETFGTFHDALTDFVFVKLPGGWTFVAADAASNRHEVFLDAATGFVFVKLSGGWKFVRAIS